MASASDWSGIMVSTLLEIANTNVTLQSLATIATLGLFWLTAALQFILMAPCSGLIHLSVLTVCSLVMTRFLEAKCSPNLHKSWVWIFFILIFAPSKITAFLDLQIWSVAKAPKTCRAGITTNSGGGVIIKSTRWAVELKFHWSSLMLQLLLNQMAFANWHWANKCNGVSFVTPPICSSTVLWLNVYHLECWPITKFQVALLVLLEAFGWP